MGKSYYSTEKNREYGRRYREKLRLSLGQAAYTAKHTAYCRRWAIKNRDRLMAEQREKKRQLKLKAIELCGGCCHRCKGSYHPAVYEFHHLDPSKKDGDLSKLGSWSRIARELEQCVMLCANCHRMEHHEARWGLDRQPTASSPRAEEEVRQQPLPF